MKKAKLENLTPRYKYISPDVSNQIFGFISVGSLIFSLFSGHLAKTELWSFISQLVLVIGFVCMGIYYQFQHAKNLNNSIQNEQLNRLNKQRLTIINSQSECIHTVAHYSRNIVNLFDKHVADLKAKSVEGKISPLELEKILLEIDFFFINITSNIRDYFNTVTNTQCAITIKILQKTEKDTFVKTLFRDPVSLKKRRKSDENVENSGKYSTRQNTAFDTIMNTTCKNQYFAHNDLSLLAATGYYKNGNPEWRKYYNATLVTSIGITTGKAEKDILGFITIDNFDGNLTDLSSIDFLYAVSDILYIVLGKYVNFIRKDMESFNIDNMGTDPKLKRMLDWS